MPDQPTADQLASFDQTHAAWSASLDTVSAAYAAELADGQNREISMAGLSQWLSATCDAGALAEHLAVAADRLYGLQLALEQAEQYARDLQDGTAPGYVEQLDAARAEGRRQATEGWEREWAVDLGGQWPMHPCDSEADARRLAAYRDGRTVVSRLVGPWEAAEQAKPSNTERPHGAFNCNMAGLPHLGPCDDVRPLPAGQDGDDRG